MIIIKSKWEITKIIETKIDNENTVVSVSAEDEYENKVSFKWDGCIDLYHEGNYIHICDVNEMIDKLQEIKRIAKETFDEENYDIYWSE